MKKLAFTLAEVLLTLAIIGVVTALTIPAVITKVTKDQYVVGLKKAYNTLKSVEREAIREHGEITNWDWSGDVVETFDIYFKPHFDILKDCGISEDEGCSHGPEGWKSLTGTPYANLNADTNYRFITSDGIGFVYRLNAYSPPSRVANFIVDVNGKKGPNTLGRDVFEFNLYPTKGIKPYGTLLSDNENVSLSPDEIEATTGDGCNTSCTGSSCGWNCPVKVLAEGAMNY